MKASILHRRALNVCAAIAMLTACGASQPLVGAPPPLASPTREIAKWP
jgi:uncharacterized lipoprotein YajG